MKGVAKNFREIFSELVPGGKGELVMQRRAPIPAAANPDEEDEDAQDQHNASEKYSGVKVKVSLYYSYGYLLEPPLACGCVHGESLQHKQRRSPVRDHLAR